MVNIEVGLTHVIELQLGLSLSEEVTKNQGVYTLYGVDNAEDLIRVISENILKDIESTLPKFASVEGAEVRFVELKKPGEQSLDKDEVENLYSKVLADDGDDVTSYELEEDGSVDVQYDKPELPPDVMGMYHAIVNASWSIMSGGNQVVDVVVSDKLVGELVEEDNLFENHKDLIIFREDLGSNYMIRYKDLNNKIEELRG